MAENQTRQRIYKALDTEREYQRRRWGHRQETSAAGEGGTFVETRQSVEEFILYMEDYLEEARKEVSRKPRENNDALEVLRKVVALGIACFEQHGVPKRNLEGTIINGRAGKPA